MKNERAKTRLNSSVTRLSSIHLGKTSMLRVFVWRIRRGIRDKFGSDLLIIESESPQSRHRARDVYRSVNEFMVKRLPGLEVNTPLNVARKMVRDQIHELGYRIVESDEKKPWGAYYRMAGDDSERFVQEFFPGLSLVEAKLGRENVELSPKFLLVAPGHRLSWQYHNRRAERWRFLTAGAYYRSHTDAMPEVLQHARAGTVVQFDAGERHRLASEPYSKNYTLVAEIWQHTQPDHPSNEEDIVRLQDDYKR